MSTVTTKLTIFESAGQSRLEIDTLTDVFGELDGCNRESKSLMPNNSLTVEAEKFCIVIIPEVCDVSITTFSLNGSNVLVANTTVNTKLQGVLMYPGKISISIMNPSTNTSELPTRVKAYYK